MVEDPAGLADPPAPRDSWIDLQGPVVAAASGGPVPAVALARALLFAVLHQPVCGPTNRLTAEAFALLLETVPEDLARSLDTSADRELYGGQRWLQEHVWRIPGPDGARWLRILVEADDTHATFLYQDVRAGTVPMWADEDWPDRLDALAQLRRAPRPGVVRVLPMTAPPRPAGPALVRVLMAHGADERDWLVRQSAANLRRLRRTDPAEDVELVDWEARHARPELFRWVLELMGGPGDRQRLVAAAAHAGAVDDTDAQWLAAPLDRPAWADGEIPWEVGDVVVAGEVVLPDGRLTGGDPWWTGGAEGLPWIITISPGRYRVRVVTATHPLAGRECAALVLGPAGSSERWALVADGRGGGQPGHHVEVGVAGFGAVGVYEAGSVFESEHADFPGTAPPPAWGTLDGGPAGTVVFCIVGPQHQICRTWLGTTAIGTPVAVVTDLGLLGLDLEAEPAPAWA